MVCIEDFKEIIVIFILASTVFGSKMELEICFSEGMLATISD